MKFYAPFKLSENISATEEGYLACKDVSIGRVGEMTYGVGETPIPPGPDGKVIVTRSAEELFRPETIASFEGKSVTILHPQDFVDPSNWSQLSNGLVHNVRRGIGAQENDLVADLLITVRRAIELVKNGLREVSCGYEAEYTETGVGRGVQTNILGNHLALVEEGRAGSSYAINDHRKGSSMTFKEKMKAIFAKAQDEAMNAACDVNTETSEKKEGFVTMKDMQSYFDEKFEAMGKKEEKPANDSTEQDPSTGKPAEAVAQDDEGEKEDAIMAVLKKILAKLEGEEANDEEGEDGEEGEDNDFEESTMSGEKTGDSAGPEDDDEDIAARVEILAPGMKIQKGVKAKALLVAYSTKDGKSVIDALNDGKAPNLKDAKSIDMLFAGASEVLKIKRAPELSIARNRVRDTFLSSSETPKGARTAEEINEANEKFYAAAK